MEEIELRWQGPFSLDSPDNRSKFLPPEQPGVYLWTVVQRSKSQISFKISYVGQSSNIRNRIYGHIAGILGGLSNLYGDEHLTLGQDPHLKVRIYTPGNQNLLNEFLNDYQRYSQLAHRNLVSYSFFWAEMLGYEGRNGEPFRKAVESALIKNAGYLLQNDRRSLEENKSPKILIKSNFSKAKELATTPLPSVMNYGERDLGRRPVAIIHSSAQL